MLNIFGQIVGFAALLFIVLSFQSKTREKILFFQLMGSIFYFLNLLLLGAITGGVSMMLGAVRNYVFAQKGKKAWANSPVWLFLFLALFIIAGTLTYKDVYSLLPIAGMSLGTLSFWMTDPRKLRLFILSTTPFWITYNFISGSIAGTMLEVFSMISIIIAIIRFDILKQKQPGQEEEIETETGSNDGSMIG